MLIYIAYHWWKENYKVIHKISLVTGFSQQQHCIKWVKELVLII